MLVMVVFFIAFRWIHLSTQLVLLFILVFFFFSSRRRHTRFKCDWSSDVCSSDLSGRWRALLKPGPPASEVLANDQTLSFPIAQDVADLDPAQMSSPTDIDILRKIGRASCRERV